jgi:malonyl-CoA O-methyltransferase
MQTQAPYFRFASQSYLEHSALQRDMALHLCKLLQQRLSLPIHSNPAALDFACGTGFLAKRLHEDFPFLKWSLNDLHEAMLNEAKQDCKHLKIEHIWPGDFNALRLPANYFALVASNAGLQWMPSALQVLQNVVHTLQPGGTLALSTFGPSTLQELYASYLHVHPQPMQRQTTYHSIQELADLAQKVGLTQIQTQQIPYRLKYDSLQGLLKTIRAMGASFAPTQNSISRQSLREWAALYQATYAIDAGVYASWEQSILVAVKPQ